MKKLILLYFMISSLIVSAQQQYYQWTLSTEIGINRFDGDVNQTMIDPFPASMWSGAYGLDIEYRFNNVFGTSVNGYYILAKAETNLNGGLKHIGTNIYTGALNGTVNITHLIFPYSLSKFTLNGSIGIGYSSYIYDLNPRLSAADMYFIERPSAGISPEFPVTDTHGLAFTLPTSLSINYQCTNKIGLGLKTSYICFNKDNLEGIWTYKGVTNDGEGLLTAYLSYNFNKIIVSERNADIYKEFDKLNYKFKLLNIKIDSLSAYVLNKKDNLTKSDTIEDYIPSVYFDFDKSNLDDWALITISKIANRLLKHPNLKVKILGYCDYMGNVPYNFTLSDKRVMRAQMELITKYHISPIRITTYGKGKLYDPKIKYRPNRRCDFIFIK